MSFSAGLMGNVGGYMDGGIGGKHLQCVERGDFPLLLSRDRKAYFTLHFTLIPRTTAQKHTLIYIHTHTHICKQKSILYIPTVGKHTYTST